MERTTNLEIAKGIMGQNYIGFQEIISIQKEMGIYIPESLVREIPEVNFPEDLLLECKNDYILILGISFSKNGTPLTINKMREQFGFNPEKSEPCFYNQDWYINEDFFNRQLDNKWYLVRKCILDETRSQSPDSINLKITFPSAVLCAYTFFVCWFHFRKIIWENDYVWCKDKDHNGDRIYVGRYIDPSSTNKNGFSIHRHLNISNLYGCIDAISQ